MLHYAGWYDRIIKLFNFRMQTFWYSWPLLCDPYFTEKEKVNIWRIKRPHFSTIATLFKISLYSVANDQFSKFPFYEKLGTFANLANGFCIRYFVN